MISLAQVKSAVISSGRRILKVFEFGAKTAVQSGPFGDDSSPLKDMVAIFGKTSNLEEPVILGYINKNQLAQPGEKRIFSLKPDGSLSIDIFLKTDGTLEIGGNVDNMIRYGPLNTALQSHNAAINMELGKIAAAISTLGGTYLPDTISTDISASKIDQVKTL
tara:strand:+ start:15592 stop:16080 length:489 start_codon:yes stop_codon:yes gene_type:complete